MAKPESRQLRKISSSVFAESGVRSQGFQPALAGSLAASRPPTVPAAVAPFARRKLIARLTTGMTRGVPVARSTLNHAVAGIE